MSFLTMLLQWLLLFSPHIQASDENQHRNLDIEGLNNTNPYLESNRDITNTNKLPAELANLSNIESDKLNQPYADDHPGLSPAEMHYTTDPTKAQKENERIRELDDKIEEEIIQERYEKIEEERIQEWKEKNDDENTQERKENQTKYISPNIANMPYYERLARLNFTTKNWTTCEQFLNNSAPLDVNRLFEVDWKIFYFWVEDDASQSYTVRFHLPTYTLVDRFRKEVEQAHEEIRPPINWTNAELWMETAIDLSALFIKTDTPGLYQFLPTLILHSDHLDHVLFALKLVEPGYLGIVNCQYQTGFSLAHSDKMPDADKALEAASTLGFFNEFGRTYTELETSIVRPQKFNDDADDYVEMQLEQDNDIMTIF